MNGKSSGRRSIGTEAVVAVVDVWGEWKWRGLNRCILRITNYALVVIFEGERWFDPY